MKENFDVIVVGGGHAGCEAALASSRYGAKTLLITINMDHIAQMSCNPAVGGIAKGHVAREVDALGGAMGKVTDAASIQFRMINNAKGPAVWSPRAQCDKAIYQLAMKRELELCENLHVKQAMAEDIIIKNRKVCGIRTDFNDEFHAESIVICSGTFLSGILHYGLKSVRGGRAGDPASLKLAKSFSDKLKLRMGRLKTGTPPRILAKTIDFSKMRKQDADCYEKQSFSFFSEEKAFPEAVKKDMPCYMVYSTPETAEIINKNIDQSPLYAGRIDGIGTRYCPSFEDKIIRFPHHEKHLLHIEPEGEFTEEYYLNGISTSLPPEVQIKMLKTVPGFENCQISRYAYAIEYDFVFPDQIYRTLQTKKYENLFLAGQINGTSGYEEAAGQGLLAGLNAAKFAEKKELLELQRDNSYIGVMIDDLVTKEIIEPYRLFTSRAEYRLKLRQDNADLRLSEFAYRNGILSGRKYQKIKKYREKLDSAEKIAHKEKLKEKKLWTVLRNMQGKCSAENCPFPISWLNLQKGESEDERIIQELSIMAHYEGYIKREEKSIAKLKTLENEKIPETFQYEKIKGLRNESRDKLIKIKPTTLAQASRIDGVTPAEIALLQVHLKRIKKLNLN